RRSPAHAPRHRLQNRIGSQISCVHPIPSISSKPIARTQDAVPGFRSESVAPYPSPWMPSGLCRPSLPAYVPARRLWMQKGTFHVPFYLLQFTFLPPVVWLPAALFFAALRSDTLLSDPWALAALPPASLRSGGLQPAPLRSATWLPALAV